MDVDIYGETNVSARYPKICYPGTPTSPTLNLIDLSHRKILHGQSHITFNHAVLGKLSTVRCKFSKLRLSV